MSNEAPPLLEIRDLTIEYRPFDRDGRPVRAVDHVGFSIGPGEALGLVGESGSGKTTIGLGIMGLLPSSAQVSSGEIRLMGDDLLTLTERELDRIRWKDVSMAFQGAMNALNPTQRVVDQIAEPLIAHSGLSRTEAIRRARELLTRVEIDDRRGDAYPHEFSGGMRQRAIIAMALACGPKLLIADEPGTALDVVVQGQILELLLDLQREFHLSTLIISHDLSVIRFLTDRCLVMYAGRVAEIGRTEEVFLKPAHPYMEMLAASFPQLADETHELQEMPDRPPDLSRLPPGCAFHPRCPYAMDRCRAVVPPLVPISVDHAAACWLRTDDV